MCKTSKGKSDRAVPFFNECNSWTRTEDDWDDARQWLGAERRRKADRARSDRTRRCTAPHSIPSSSLSRSNDRLFLCLSKSHLTQFLLLHFFDSYVSVFLCLFWVGSIFCPCLNAGKPEFLNSHCAFLPLNFLLWRTHPHPRHPCLPWKEPLLSELPLDMFICFLGLLMASQTRHEHNWTFDLQFLPSSKSLQPPFFYKMITLFSGYQIQHHFWQIHFIFLILMAGES